MDCCIKSSERKYEIGELRKFLYFYQNRDKYSRLLQIVDTVSALDYNTLGINIDCLHLFLRSLHYSTAHGNWRKIIDVMVRHSYDINSRDHQGCTPLLSYLKNMQHDLNTASALQHNSGYKKTKRVPPADVIRELIRHGALVNRPSYQGETALYTTVSMPNLELTNIILNAGGSVNSILGVNVLYALSRGCELMPRNDKARAQAEGIIQLVKDKLNVREEGIKGSTIFHFAASSCSTQFIDVLGGVFELELDIRPHKSHRQFR